MPQAARTCRSSRARLASAAGVLLALSISGAKAQTALTYNPNHFVNNDPIWELFNQAQVQADMKKGAYDARFPAALETQAGRTLRVAGFILPLEATQRSAHFMLVRRNTGCPFCPPNAPTEAVEVMADHPVAYTGEEIAVTGRLKLIASSSDGLFFRLEAAQVVPAR